MFKCMTIPEIKNFLKDSFRNNRKFFIYGGRGSGKSTLLAQTFKEVLDELEAENRRTQNESKARYPH